LSFFYQIKYFSRNYRLVFWDYRAHNRSEFPQGADQADLIDKINLTRCANDLKQVLTELNIDRAMFVGHSMGVPVLIKAYSLFPEKFHGMALVAGSSRSPFEMMFNSTKLMPSLYNLLYKLISSYPYPIQLLWKNTFKTNLPNLLARLIGFSFWLSSSNDLMNYIDRLKNFSLPVIFNYMKITHEFNGDKILSEITCPTLCVAGERDLIVPEPVMAQINAKIKNSKHVVIPWGSHFPQIDLPELFNMRLEEFLQEIKF